MQQHDNLRLSAIDTAKGIAVLLVLFHHLFCHYGISTTISSFVIDIITSFHVPVFFFISGMLFSRKRDFKEFFLNKCRKLLLPFFFFYTISLCFVLGLLLIGFDIPYLRNVSYLRIICDFWTNSCLWVNIPLWFFPSMFFSSIFFYVVTSVNNSYIKYSIAFTMVMVGCILSILECNLPLGISSALTCMSFMVAGNIYGFWSKNHSIKQVHIVCLVLVYITLFFINRDFGWMRNFFLNPIAAIGSGIIGSVLLISACRITTTKGAFFTFCGRNSLFFFSMHYLFLRLNAKILSKINFVEIEMILNFILMVIMCIIISVCLKKYLPFMWGMKKD